jgi:septal ring factor EnvC (AmiA/AmiB activator)
MEQERFQKELTEQEQAVALEKGKRDRLLAEVREQKRLELASLEMLKEDALALDRKLISYAKAVSKKEEPRPSVYVDKPARKTAVEPLEPEPAKPSARISKEPAPEGRGAEKTGKDFTGQERFDRLKGLLKMPVKGKVVNRFGSYHNPEYNITNFRSGIDIKARQGEPILAVHSGKVLYAEWFKGYGNMIILDHGNHYYTVYANIEELYKKTGDHVDRHETIATVGDTGSVMGPKLYFEIRHFGKPLNPMKWIQAG